MGTFRKLARESVIFMLLGPVVAALVAFGFLERRVVAPVRVEITWAHGLVRLLDAVVSRREEPSTHIDCVATTPLRILLASSELRALRCSAIVEYACRKNGGNATMLCKVREGLLYERVCLVMQRALLSGWHGWIFHNRLIRKFRQNNRDLGRHTADNCSLCEMDSLDPQDEKLERGLILKFAKEKADSLYQTIASGLGGESAASDLTRFFGYEGR